TVLPNRADLDRLLGYLERREVAAGAQLMAQGAVADDLYFIEAGQGTAQLEREGGAPMRLQTVAGRKWGGRGGMDLGKATHAQSSVRHTLCALPVKRGGVGTDAHGGARSGSGGACAYRRRYGRAAHPQPSRAGRRP